jgi:hypothetical protein
MSSKKFDLSELVNSEANIWACIYRGINRKKDNNDYDEEDLDDDSQYMMMHSMNVSDMRALSNQLPILFPHSPQINNLDDYFNKYTIPEESVSDEGENINDLVDEPPSQTEELSKIDIVKSKSINPSKNIYFKHKEGVPPLCKKSANKSKF